MPIFILAKKPGSFVVFMPSSWNNSLYFLIKSLTPVPETNFHGGIHIACPGTPVPSFWWRKDLAYDRYNLFHQPRNFYPDFLLIGHITISKSQIPWSLQLVDHFKWLFSISGGIIALIMPRWVPCFSRDGRWTHNWSVFVRQENIAEK